MLTVHKLRTAANHLDAMGRWRGRQKRTKGLMVTDVEHDRMTPDMATATAEFLRVCARRAEGKTPMALAGIENYWWVGHVEVMCDLIIAASQADPDE